MKINELDNVCAPEKQDRIHEFCDWCCEELGIDVPHLRMAPKNDTTALGYTDMSDGSVTIVVGDRHQMDIMRTLAHELVHVRQMKSYEPDGATGSKDENEANAMAGVLMREWGQNNPDLYTEGKNMREDSSSVSNYNPDGKTYKGKRMPSLDDDDLNNMAQDIDSFDDNEFAYDHDMDKSIDDDNRNKKMADILDGLDPREQKIMKMRYVDGMTQGQIAKEFELSTTRIQHIEQKALRKLRHPTRLDQLAPYTEARLSMKKPKKSAQDRFNDRLKKNGIDLDDNLKKYKEMMDRLSAIPGTPKKADESFGDPSRASKERAANAQQDITDYEYEKNVASNATVGIRRNTSEDIDTSSVVYTQFLELTNMSLPQLRNEIARVNRGDDVSGYDTKAGAIAQILRDRHGDRKVNQAMGLGEPVKQIDESKTAKLMALIIALGATYGLKDEAREFAYKIQRNIEDAQNAKPNPGRPDPVTQGNPEPGPDRVMRPPVRPQVDEIAPAGRPKSIREAFKVQPIKEEVMGAVRSGNPREMKRVNETIGKRIADLMELRGTAGKKVDAEIMTALPVLKKAQMMLRDKQKMSEAKTRLDPKCWKGKKIGNPKTKVKGGVRVNNCVPKE
jgi:RNA polymerase sigma factor (sigma-70 family)